MWIEKADTYDLVNTDHLISIYKRREWVEEIQDVVHTIFATTVDGEIVKLGSFCREDDASEEWDFIREAIDNTRGYYGVNTDVHWTGKLEKMDAVDKQRSNNNGD